MVVDHNMFTPLVLLFLIVFGILNSIAILANGFIIFVNSHHWLRTRKLVPCDLLLTWIGTFRVLSQLLSLINQYRYISSPTYHNGYESKLVGMIWSYVIFGDCACVTSLTVFYCVKVTDFAHSLFLWLKSKINRLVPRMLMIPLLINLVIYLPLVVTYFAREKCHNLTGNLPEKKCQDKLADEYLFKVYSYLQLYLTAFSFSICITASFLLIFSLWRHTRNLKKNHFGINDLSTQVHINVIKLQVFSLSLYFVYFVLLTIAMTDTLPFGNINRLIADTILLSCPSVHSVILILTNPKLKGACAQILRVRGRPA